jgi:hypothetical protein
MMKIQKTKLTGSQEVLAIAYPFPQTAITPLKNNPTAIAYLSS